MAESWNCVLIRIPYPPFIHTHIAMMNPSTPSSTTTTMPPPSSSNSNPNPPQAAAESRTQSTELESLSAQTATVTLTETSTSSVASMSQRQDQDEEVYSLSLTSQRPNVTWDTSTIDNEGLGRKSSKRCCIFHKPRDFGESSSESDDDDNGSESDASTSSDEYGRAGVVGHSNHLKKTKSKRKQIARVKKQTVPDFQRYHA